MRTPMAVGIAAVVALGCGSSSVGVAPDAADAASETRGNDVDLGPTTVDGADGATETDGATESHAGCPAAAPFDDSDPALISACAVPIAVAVGNGLRRALTTDGTTWDHDVYTPDTGTDQNENSHRDVLVARGLIFVVGDGGLLVSSDGGESFAVARAGRFHDSALAYFQGVIWMISNLGTFSTTDGKTWKEYSGAAMLPGNLPGAFSATGGAAVTGGSLLLVVSNRQTSARLFDGTTWIQHDFDRTTYGSLSSAAFGGGRFVILGSACCDKAAFAGLRATSPDGVTWTATSNASAGAAANLRFGSVLWRGTSFFATASQYDRRTYASTDGLAWTSQPSNVGIGAVAPFKGDYQGINGALIYRSTDGLAWSAVHTGVGDQKWGYSAIRGGFVLRR